MSSEKQQTSSKVQRYIVLLRIEQMRFLLDRGQTEWAFLKHAARTYNATTKKPTCPPASKGLATLQYLVVPQMHHYFQ